MTEIVRYVNRQTGIMITVTRDYDDMFELAVKEHGKLVRREVYGKSDEDYVLSLASGRAIKLDAQRVLAANEQMTSPLRSADQVRSTVPAGTSQDLTPAQEVVLKYATLAGYATVGSGGREFNTATFRALADRGWLELDYHHAVVARVVGGYITEAGERRMRRETLAVVR